MLSAPWLFWRLAWWFNFGGSTHKLTCKGMKLWNSSCRSWHNSWFLSWFPFPRACHWLFRWAWHTHLDKCTLKIEFWSKTSDQLRSWAKFKRSAPEWLVHLLKAIWKLAKYTVWTKLSNKLKQVALFRTRPDVAFLLSKWKAKKMFLCHSKLSNFWKVQLCQMTWKSFWNKVSWWTITVISK